MGAQPLAAFSPSGGESCSQPQLEIPWLLLALLTTVFQGALCLSHPHACRQPRTAPPAPPPHHWWPLHACALLARVQVPQDVRMEPWWLVSVVNLGGWVAACWAPPPRYAAIVLGLVQSHVNTPSQTHTPLRHAALPSEHTAPVTFAPAHFSHDIAVPCGSRCASCCDVLLVMLHNVLRRAMLCCHAVPSRAVQVSRSTATWTSRRRPT